MNILKEIVLKKSVDKTPIWIMRQAGRYLPEYQARKKECNSLMEMFLTEDVIYDITMQPMDRFGFDAAIIFSDILIILKSFGVDVSFSDKDGPIIIEDRLDKGSLDFCKPIYNAISRVRENLDKRKSLIGFVGGPWTVFTFMKEVKGSKYHSASKQFAINNKKETLKTLDMIVESSVEHLRNQIDSGADVVKIFESSAGVADIDMYDDLIINPTRRIVSELKNSHPDIPIIGFPRGASFKYIDYVQKTGVDVLAVDSYVPLDFIKDHLSKHAIIQGNLDNVAMLAKDKNEIKVRVDKIMELLDSGKFIFNLGHGILPDTPIENVEYLIEYIRNWKK